MCKCCATVCCVYRSRGALTICNRYKALCILFTMGGGLGIGCGVCACCRALWSESGVLGEDAGCPFDPRLSGYPRVLGPLFNPAENFLVSLTRRI